MASTIRTKIYFTPGDQVRRIKIDSNVSYEDIKQQLTKYHEASPLFKKIGEYVYQVVYQDDEGDWVIIETEDEWREALVSQQKKKDDLMRIKFIAINKSLESINKCRKNCQKAVTDRYNKNVKPMINQLKEYLKDPQKHQEAVDWLKEITSKLGNQAQTGFNDVQTKVDTWLKTNELPQKMETYMKEFEQMANTLADRVEEVISNTLANEDDEEEVEEYEVVEEVIHPVEESHIQLHEEEKKEEEIKPSPVEEIVEIAEEKEPEIEVPPQYIEHMRSLTEMGFQDKSLNLRLLKENKGDLVKTVSALLSLPL
jgi:uncharacterized protein YoxC